MDTQHDETEAIRALLRESNAAARAAARLAHREGSQAPQEGPAAASRRPALPIPQTRRARALRALQRLVTAPELWFVVALALTAGAAHAGGIIGTVDDGAAHVEFSDVTCRGMADALERRGGADIAPAFLARMRAVPGHAAAFRTSTAYGFGCYTITAYGARLVMISPFGHASMITIPAEQIIWTDPQPSEFGEAD